MANLLRSKYYENLLEILSNDDNEVTRNSKIKDYLNQFSPITNNDKTYSENLAKCKSIGLLIELMN